MSTPETQPGCDHCDHRIPANSAITSHSWPPISYPHQEECRGSQISHFDRLGIRSRERAAGPFRTERLLLAIVQCITPRLLDGVFAGFPCPMSVDLFTLRFLQHDTRDPSEDSFGLGLVYDLCRPAPDQDDHPRHCPLCTTANKMLEAQLKLAAALRHALQGDVSDLRSLLSLMKDVRTIIWLIDCLPFVILLVFLRPLSYGLIVHCRRLVRWLGLSE